jgi:hypothetical protein
MDAIENYRKYARDALEMAEKATCEIERTTLIAVAQGWLQIAATLSTIVGSRVTPRSESMPA